MKKIVILFTLVLVWALAMPALACKQNNDGNRHRLECKRNNDGEKHCTAKITGVLEGSLEFVMLPGADPNNPADFYKVDELGYSSGIVRGLGVTHMFQFHRPEQDGSGALMDGHVKIVTSSNDMIIGIYEGGTTDIVSEDQIEGNIDFIIIGGTGRFENASGTIHATAYITYDFMEWEWPATWVLEGEIEY